MKSRAPIAAVLIGVACVAGQFVPLLDVLGYEYSTYVGVLVTLAGIAHSARVADRRAGRSWWRAAARAAVAPLGWIALAGLISAANMLRVRNCEPGVGLVYLLIFGVGAVPMAIATGFVASYLQGARRWFVAYGLVLASLASTLATLALQPTIVAYDTYIGYYAGSIYDESLVSVWPHVLFRLWNLLWALFVVVLLEFRRRPNRQLVVAGAVIGGTLCSIFAFRGDLHLERGRGYVAADLGGLVETEHFEIYYDQDYFDARDLALLVSDHEARYAELAEFWEVEPDLPLRSFVYGNRDRKGALMGGRRTLVAKIWLGEMHITWRGLGDELLAHEMAHLFLRRDGYGPLKLSSRGGLLPIMALVEGAATSAAWGATELDYHHWSAAIYELDLGEDIRDILGPRGFWSRYSRLAYTLTGSFGRWLIDEFGPARFREAYRRGDFDSAYGTSLDTLLEDWRAFLSTIELTEEQLETARFRYDRPSLFGRMCARSIATRFQEGEAFVVQGRENDARRCFEGILADDPDNVDYRLSIARTYHSMGLAEDAIRHADHIIGADGAGRASVDRALELIADRRWMDGDFAVAEATYDELSSRAGTAGDRRRLLAKAHALSNRSQYPLTAAAVRRALVDRPAASGSATAAELAWAAAVENSNLAAYLTLLRLEDDGRADLYEEVFRSITLDELSEDQALRALQSRALHLTLAGDDAACPAWDGLRQRAPTGSAIAATAEMWRGRCRRGTLPPPATTP